MWYRNRSKYQAIKVKIDGIKFDSKMEAKRYLQLKELEKAGEIRNLRLQESFELQPKFKDKDGKTIRAITYIADFVYEQDGETIVEDTKGIETTDFKIKKKLLLYRYPNINFYINKKV